MNIRKCLRIAFVVLLTITYSNAARILAAFAFNSKSHFMMTKALIKELIIRGHEVTFITCFPMENDLGSNYTEVLIHPEYQFWVTVGNHFKINNIFEFENINLNGNLEMVDILGVSTTEHALRHPKVREIFDRKDTKDVYDLLIAEQFYQEALLALGIKYDIPVITVSTMGYENYMSQMMGVITPWSFVPSGLFAFNDKMSLWERMQNTIGSLYEDYYREYVYFPKQDALVKKYLSHMPMQIPKVSQMEKNISVMLLNSHVPITTPRPTILGMIPVGGMHIYPAKPLPTDIKKFLDEATHGAVYFSLGSNIQSANMPPEKLEIFLEVFAGMKQRILWKFENDEIPKLPKNVMIKKWMPQSDILAHPNVKVFITHGGLFGTQEGVYYGVPMLGIPIFFDQFLNINKAAKAGYGIKLSFQAITKDILKSSLTELLENPSYKKNIQQASAIFRDRPLSARDTAMYWVDYVIRHKGAPHIRSAGLDLAWYEFYLLDVIGLIFLGIITVATWAFLAIKILIGSKKAKEKSS